MRAWWDRGALSREKARALSVLGVLALIPLSAGVAVGTWAVVILRAKTHA